MKDINNITFKKGKSFCMKFYIKGTLYFMFNRSDFVGIQSYLEGADSIYYIDIELKSKTINLEFDNRSLWEEMLGWFDKLF